MFSRFIFLGLVALALFVYMTNQGPRVDSAEIRQSCAGVSLPGEESDPSVRVAIDWRRPREGALESWLDLSLGPQFIPGMYRGFGPFQRSQSEQVIEALPPDIEFYYRVNTRYEDAWEITARGSFVTACPTLVAGSATSITRP